MAINEKITFANRWIKLHKDERKLIEFLLNCKNNQYVSSKQNLGITLGYGIENSQFNKYVKHCADVGIISMTNSEPREKGKRYELVFKLNSDWENVLMTHSDFDTIEKPTTSFRKDPNLNIKEYNKKAYLRKKNMKLSDKIGE